MGNPQEIVDIVNENDEILYQVTKQEAHNKGLLHRTVICEVIDSKGNWTLVQQHTQKQDPGVYLSPIGGHVSAGETNEAALKREMEEEGGLTNAPMKYIDKVIYNREVPHLHRQENHYFILYEVYSDAVLKLGDESVSQKKFSPKELKQKLKQNPELFGKPFKFLLKKFYPHLIDG